ncbi:MAG: hypothetical protein ACTHJ0_13335 [Flavipsychrobacter sp.]
MDNLRDLLMQQYFSRKYSMEQIANDIVNLLNADENNYTDVTGFAKNFYLLNTLAQSEKKHFYNELKTRNFFQILDTFLYSDNFSICSWTVYIMGKFSNNENACYLEMAYETSFILRNPILAYRCLSELDWLRSKKVELYLVNLRADNSIFSKLILLYYWEIQNSNSAFKDLLRDNDFTSFILSNQRLINTEEEICDRLWSFENHISKLYKSNWKDMDKSQLENIAKKYFETYLKPID